MKPKKMDSFFISKAEVTFMQEMEDGTVSNMFMENTFGEELILFEGNSDELEKLIIDKCMINLETKSMKFVTVYGNEYLGTATKILEAKKEYIECLLDDDDAVDDPEQKAYAFYLDNR